MAVVKWYFGMTWNFYCNAAKLVMIVALRIVNRLLITILL